MGRSIKDLDNYIQEAIKNIRDDRDITSTLLTQVFAEITNGGETHKDMGLIAAKYVETLYVNVLGRDYDQSGYNYWLGNLNNGLETRHELLLGFAESGENKVLFSEMTGFV